MDKGRVDIQEKMYIGRGINIRFRFSYPLIYPLYPKNMLRIVPRVGWIGD